MASVFRVFRKPIAVDAQKTETIVLAACALHNLMLSKKTSLQHYAPPGTVDQENYTRVMAKRGYAEKQPFAS
jgi:hypothetical protein